MSHLFAMERLDAAVAVLATDPERVRTRLARAFELHLAELDPAKDLPVPLRERFAAVRRALTHLGKTEVEPWSAAIGLNEAEAVELAGSIVGLATELRSRLDR
jgi:hypothetical protein